MSYIFRSQMVNTFYRKIFISLEFITFLILISFNYLNAQDNDINPQANYVIASALRLRESPNKDAKILTAIPFGSRVEYLTNQCYNKDTILVPLHDDNYPVVGSWVYVKYKNIKGFVLNSYLSYYDNSSPEHNDLNNEYLILYPGCDCNFNIHNVTNWNFYGFYKTENDSLKIRRIKINYISEYEDYTCPLILYTTEYKNLEFVIGSKEEMFRDKSTVLHKSAEILYNENEKQLTKELKKVGLTLLDHSNKTRDDFFELIYSEENKKQMLNLKGFAFPTRINFIGDLDNDSKYDFIISYGETAGPTILYLSSQANENKLLKMVASFFSSYCC
jgi:Bacterial SH3 domain